MRRAIQCVFAAAGLFGAPWAFGDEAALTAESLVVCDTQESAPLPPGRRRWAEFRPALPRFTIVERWLDADGRERESLDTLLDERLACGVGFDRPLTEACGLQSPLPDPAMPGFGRYLTTWDCGGGVNDRLTGSVSLSLGALPGSAFRCTIGTEGGPTARAVFLRNCRRVN